jgi:signal transduction histidine kinase
MGSRLDQSAATSSALGGVEKRARGLVLLAFVMACAWAAGQAQPGISIPHRRNVLLLSQVGLSHPAAAIVNQQILMAVANTPQYQVEVFTESVDSTIFPDDAMQLRIRDWLRVKYRNEPPDVIVAFGPQVVEFLRHSPGSFFPGTPVVFCSLFAPPDGVPAPDLELTGAWSRLDPAMTLSVAQELVPGTEHVAVVGGASTFDRAIEGIVSTGLQSFDPKLDVQYLTSLEMSKLLEKLRNLPPHTIVLFTSLFQDGAGTRFVSATAALPLIAGASNAPVFGMSDTYLGHGVVGGYVILQQEQGRIAGQMVTEILGGKSPHDIRVREGPKAYMFDWRELKRWGLDDRRLPQGSVVLYREPTLWEKSKSLLIGSAIVILACVLIIAYVLLQQRQLKQAQREQNRLSGMLISAEEKERSRLASELHDDFSQRLATVALGLETAAELIRQSPQEADCKLHELTDEVGEIGADLHTLSHRLHSSTLESLGLVPGVSALCREFSSRQNIRISFEYRNVPPGIPAEIALCLFRITQEALRNLKKHSGAPEGYVRLEGNSHQIHLTIRDEGSGFDLRNGAGQSGLGMWSMKERARMVGGYCQVHSYIQKGTRVEAWVPLHQVVSNEQSA